ncbi:extracellular solute-binding protein [Paenibacillus sp. FSL H7-0331]|uniref:extracellular solute-binding protein n=1 Tax=Paenibacillus sp. FSL H7-0331 TaxID=1920421 RepID=UPI0015C3BA7F|nr:extracellular solute-binding protein [Paenibacillus sp. FSL H7-0331]
MKSITSNKRTISLICVLSTVVTMAAGCANQEKGNAATTPAAGSEPLKLSIMATYYTPQPPNAQNEAWKKLQELTGTSIDMTWVPRSAFDDKVSVSIASNDLPKVMLALKYNAAPLVNAIKSGVFWEIGPYLKDYKNLNAMNPIPFNNTKIDGKIYGLYRPRPISRHGIIFRKDWLDNLGLKEPKTPEELYTVLKAFTHDDPDRNGKNDTLGMAEYKDIESYLMPHMAAIFGAPNKWNEDKGAFTAEFMTKEYLDALKFIKRLYDEKLMNQDFVVTEELQRSTMFYQGKTGIVLGNADGAGSMQNELRKNLPDAKVELMGGIAGPKGERNMAQQGYTGVYLFPKSSVKTEAELKKILSFFDKLLEPDAVNLLAWGMEGKQYKLVDGQVEKLLDNEKFTSDLLGLDELRIDDKAKELPLKGEDAITKKAKKAMQDNEKKAVLNPSLGLESETLVQKGTELNKIINDAKIKFITGKLDEAGWNKAVEDWIKAGGDKVMTELAESLKKSQTK